MSNFYSSPEYRETQARIAKTNWRRGKYDSLIKPLERRSCKNPDCGYAFRVKTSGRKIYCSQSCAAHVNNQGQNRHKTGRKKAFCLSCKSLLKNVQKKYCSLMCQQNFYYEAQLSQWLSGKISGEVGIRTKTISSFIRKYLRLKFKSKCAMCGWHEINPTTSKVPLEIDHINGKADDNREENLRLICPNCHSLSSNFRGLNRGSGRKWRTAKYLREQA